MWLVYTWLVFAMAGCIGGPIVGFLLRELIYECEDEQNNRVPHIPLEALIQHVEERRAAEVGQQWV